MMTDIKTYLKKGIDDDRFPGAHYAYVTKELLKTDFVGYKQIYPAKAVSYTHLTLPTKRIV